MSSIKERIAAMNAAAAADKGESDKLEPVRRGSSAAVAAKVSTIRVSSVEFCCGGIWLQVFLSHGTLSLRWVGSSVVSTYCNKRN